MKLFVTDKKPLGYTTVGYWRWTEKNNKGTLEVYVASVKVWRHFMAILGHELIEVFYCWLFHVTTEQADAFHQTYEDAYKAGTIHPSVEPGHDPKCPYHWGHMAGVCWEHFWIFCTFAGWKRYVSECDRIMDSWAKTE